MRLCAAAVGAALAAAASADPFEIMRERARALMCWPAPSSVAATASAARGFAAALNATCFWPDVNYHDPTDRADWSTLTHLARTVTMVEALTAPGSPAFEDPALTQATHCALGVWLERGFTNDKCVIAATAPNA